MDGNKEGVSVKQIEEFAKKHRFEVFFCLMFGLACLFGVIGYFGPRWSLLSVAVGGILAVIFQDNVTGLLKKMVQFIFKCEKTVQIILGIVILILAIFLPVLIFLITGLAGGKALSQQASDSSTTGRM